MTTTQTHTTSLDQLLSAFPLPPLEPGQRPTHVWGYFETVDDEGEATWHERSSLDVDPATVYAEVSGYLAGLEAADVWFEDDEVIDAGADDEADGAAQDTPADGAQDETDVPLDARFAGLSVAAFEAEEELTGRFLMLVLSTDEHGEPARDVYSPELSDEEVMGLLRVAQLRLTDVLAWDVSAPTSTMVTEDPERVPLSSLFPDWEFETVDDVADVTAAWALIETVDDEGTVTWVQRESEGLALGELLSLLAVRVTGTEERLLADYEIADLLADAAAGLLDDEDDESPAGLAEGAPEGDAAGETGPHAVGQVENDDLAEPADEDDEDLDGDDEDDELDEFAPLDERFDALSVAALPAGQRARRALLLVLAEEDGQSPRFALYGADPAEELDYPYIEDIEELGLLRSQERRLRLDLAW